MKPSAAQLGHFIDEISERLGKASKTVYSVTNDRGFVPSLEVFDKQVYSVDASAYKLVRQKDLAYNPSRINVGSIAVCNDPNGGAVSPMYVIVRCRNELLPDYLIYFLKSPIGLSEINHRTEGSVRFQLKFRDLQRISIYLPPLPEQKRIVGILDEADELRKLRQRADQRTAELIPAIFYEMFGDPGRNEKGWDIARAGDLMILCEYGTSQKANENGIGIPIIRMNNVTPDGSLNLKDIKHVEIKPDELSKYLLEAGDILFNRTNSRELVGKTGMWDGRFDAVAASYFIRVRFDEKKEHPQHFTSFMNLPLMKRRLAEMARGAVGQANINSKELQSIQLPVPHVELQLNFAKRVSDVRAMEEKQTESRKKIGELFHSLLGKAFKGDL